MALVDWNEANRYIQGTVRALGLSYSVGQIASLVRDAQSGARRVGDIVQQLREEARNPRSVSRFEQAIGPPPAKRSRMDSTMSTVPVGRGGTVGDPSGSYVQIQSLKSKRGKVVGRNTRRKYLVDTITAPVRFRFGWVSDISAQYGKYWLSNKLSQSAAWQHMPVYLMPLFHINQGDAGDGNTTYDAGMGMWHLQRDISGVGTLANNYRWVNVAGVDPTDGTTARTTMKAVTPTESATVHLGRKALCDWTRIRLCVWGKKKNPSHVRISLIRFKHEEYCPEFHNDLTSAAPYSVATTQGYSRVRKFWDERMKYLLNGHMSGYGIDVDSMPFYILNSWTLKFNPIDASAETTDSDNRAHMKHLDIFNRWNRVCDFGTTGINETGTTQSWAQLKNENYVLGAVTGDCAYLREREKMVYLLIESVQPLEDTNADTAVLPQPPVAPLSYTDLTCSFDYVLESNWTSLGVHV